jgi:1-acyl-sn-glycerol-3-phosphate acyltransferase
MSLEHFSAKPSPARLIRGWEPVRRGKCDPCKAICTDSLSVRAKSPLDANPSIWEPPAARALLRWPLPDQSSVNACLVRLLALIARGRVLGISGLEHVRPAVDPFILAINHTTRTEALLVPALIMLHRGGRLIHFLADWNFRLIPGIGLIYRRAETITVTAKPARPRLLDALKPLYQDSRNVLDRARRCLARGHSVGIFPEGKVNRDPRRLLTGRRSAALLSLETGVPVVPVGIRFPHAAPGRPIRDRDPMEVHIGPPLHTPARSANRMSRAALHDRHAAIMSAIARLSGKFWTADLEGRHEL